MERMPTVESPKTSEKNREELYFDTLKAKRDVLSSHYTLNQLRKGRKVNEMSEAEIEDYRSVKREYDKRKELFLGSFDNLSEDDGQKVSEFTSLTKVEIVLSSLEKPAKVEVTPEIEVAPAPIPTPAPENVDQTVVETPVTRIPEDIVGETRIHPDDFDSAGAGEVVSPVDAENPDRGTTMAEVDRMLKYSQDTARPPETAYWEAKKAELLERQESESNQDRPAPKGFLQRVKDSYNRAKESLIGANAISGGSETVESRMSPLGLRKEAMESMTPVEPTTPTEPAQPAQPAQPIQPAEATQPETTPQQPEKAATGEPRQEREPKKASGWGWLKERGKGVWNFGLWEFHQAERFRSKTKEAANDTEALATLIQQERNLSLEEAEKEAWETIEELKKNNLDISAPEFYEANRDISERKRKENDEEIEYIVRFASNDLLDKLTKYRGEAGQDVLTQENKLAFQADLRGELNKMRDGAIRKDFINFAKLMRKNLDENWNWRYVWGAAEAVLGFVGVKLLVLKWEAIQAAKLVAAEKAAAGGAEAGVTATQESLVGHLQQSIWKDLANSGVPTDKLPDLTKQVLNSNNLSDRVLQGVKGGLDAWRLPSNFTIDYSSIGKQLTDLGVNLAKLGVR